MRPRQKLRDGRTSQNRLRRRRHRPLGSQAKESRVRRGWRRAFDVGVGALIVAVLAFALQLIDSAAINRFWQRSRGLVTGESPPPEIQGLPYSLNTAELPRKPVQIDYGGYVDQPFRAITKRLDLLKAIIGRDDPDQGFADDAPIGRVRLQILEGGKSVVFDKQVIARNNTATSTQTDIAVQPGQTYVFRVINDEQGVRLGMYFTNEEREPGTIVQERPGESPYSYPHQLAASIRGHD
jgi:hypothetical protein